MRLQYDVVCLSHLRWDFVYQRPQHLLSRFARNGRVFFVEEPVALEEGVATCRLDISEHDSGVTVVVPRLPEGCTGIDADEALRPLLDELLFEQQIKDYVLWYYTPVAMGFTRHLPTPLATVYDCMDELSAFRGAPPELLLREAELFPRVDLVFTGGHSLYEVKRRQHPSVHAFPSSVDVAHFARARRPRADLADQASIPHPRLGFSGVLDERFDAELVRDVADLRPDWSLVLIGPVVKIDPASLPHRPNIHYLGAKPYTDLPAYLAGWDVALIPFARNESTRFISPTKTPEYLAAGCPVVSTSIRDVVRPYGVEGLVRIADEAQGFVDAVEALLREDRAERLQQVDAFLADISWERTWTAMDRLVREAIARRQPAWGGQSARAA